MLDFNFNDIVDNDYVRKDISKVADSAMFLSYFDKTKTITEAAKNYFLNEIFHEKFHETANELFRRYGAK